MRLSLVAAVAAALVATTSPAQADVWSAKDRRGDVRATPVQLDKRGAPDDCSGPHGHRVASDKRRDVLGLGVDHTADSVVLTLSMRDIARHDRDTMFDFHLQTPRGDYALSFWPGETDPVEDVILTEEPDYPDPEDIEDCQFTTLSTVLPCEGLTVARDGTLDRVVVTVPRGCLRSPSWVRAAAEVRGFSGPTASGGFMIFSDFWSRHGEQRHGFLPPFGPRVHGG
jgi:hypothetical protein